jgi:Family of unknown function (DUF7003)
LVRLQNIKGNVVAASYTEDEILGALDDVQGGEPWEWPSFDHEDYSTLTVRLATFRDEECWAIFLCTVEWSSQDFLTSVVMPVGNCVQVPRPEDFEQLRAEHIEYVKEAQQQTRESYPEEMWALLGVSADGDEEFDPDLEDEIERNADYTSRRLRTVEFEYDPDDESLAGHGYVSSVRIRGTVIDLSQFDIDEDNETEGSFRLGLAILRQYRSEILPTDVELARFFHEKAPPPFLQVEAWHYSKWGLASEWEVFQQLAHAMVEGEPSLYQPTEEPSTDYNG